MNTIFQRIRAWFRHMPSDMQPPFKTGGQIPPHTLPDKVNTHQVDITMPHIVRFGDGTYGVRTYSLGPTSGLLVDAMYYDSVLKIWQKCRVVYPDLNHVYKIMDDLRAEREQQEIERLKRKVVEIIPHAPLRAVAQSQVETVLSDGSIFTIDHVQSDDDLRNW